MIKSHTLKTLLLLTIVNTYIFLKVSSSFIFSSILYFISNGRQDQFAISLLSDLQYSFIELIALYNSSRLYFPISTIGSI
ncbi:hypothetical protein PPV_Vac110-(228-227)n1 [Avipoxvirus sp.]|nr:hypothetical protein PPV_Vac110-(228-227)n1 [Avipoxvirus sp.]